MFEKLLEEISKMEIENETQFEADVLKLFPEEIIKEEHDKNALMESVKAVKKIMTSVGKKLGGDKAMNDLEGLLGLKKKAVKKEDEKTPEEVAKENKEAVLKQLKEEGYNIEEPKKPKTSEGGMDIKEIAKMFDEKLKPMNDKMENIEKENKSLAAQLKESKDKNQVSEFEEIAKGLGFKGTKITEIAKILKSSSENLDEAQMKTLTQTLGAQNNVNGNLLHIFKELGTGQGDDLGAESDIEKAKVAIMKEDSKLTEYEAENLAYERNPGLYSNYLKENPAQV